MSAEHSLQPVGSIAEAMRRSGGRVSFTAGQVLFVESEAIALVPLIEHGRVRVTRASADGSEITLYEIHPGETCVLAADGALTGRPYTATAIADSDGSAWMVPAEVFNELFGEDLDLRRAIMDLMYLRLARVMDLVEDVTFRPVSSRLARYLLRHPEGKDVIAETHQSVASQLGTAREVVSRNLKEFEQEGLVRLGRGRIQIVDRVRLIATAEKMRE